MVKSVLVVCIGNICRSPTGERLLKKYCPDKIVDSAGINALLEHGADDTAAKIAQDNGIHLDGHISKQLTKELCKKYELILVMEREHINYVCELCPEIRGKVLLFGYWLDQKEIPDPYRKSEDAFKAVYRLIDESAKKWANAFNR